MPKIKVSEWVSQWQGHLLSCSVHLKNKRKWKQEMRSKSKFTKKEHDILKTHSLGSVKIISQNDNSHYFTEWFVCESVVQ